jgi:hypothetical protein
MKALQEAIRYVEELKALPDVVERAKVKKRVLKVGDYTFTGLG